MGDRWGMASLVAFLFQKSRFFDLFPKRKYLTAQLVHNSLRTSASNAPVDVGKAARLLSTH